MNKSTSGKISGSDGTHDIAMAPNYRHEFLSRRLFDSSAPDEQNRTNFSLKDNKNLGHMTSDSIYGYSRRIETIKRGLAGYDNGRIAGRFLDALADHGLSNGRRLPWESYSLDACAFPEDS